MNYTEIVNTGGLKKIVRQNKNESKQNIEANLLREIKRKQKIIDSCNL